MFVKVSAHQLSIFNVLGKLDIIEFFLKSKEYDEDGKVWIFIVLGPLEYVVMT